VTYVTSQAPSTVTDAASGIQVAIPAGAIPGDGRAFAITKVTGAADPSAPPPIPQEAPQTLPAGTNFTAGGKILQLSFVDALGDPVTPLQRITVRFPFTAVDFALTAQGGNLRVLRAETGGTTWDPQPSSIDFGTFKVSSRVQCCSFFALSVVEEVATPTPTPTSAAVPPTPTAIPIPTPTAVVPAVGDVAPSSRLLVVLLMVGVALVGGGAFYIRRRSES
jgi:hypothetical protein